MTSDEHREHVLTEAAAQGRRMKKADDNWQPVMLIDLPNGERTVIEIPPPLVGTETAQTMLAGMLTAAVATQRGHVRWATVQPAVLEGNDDDHEAVVVVVGATNESGIELWKARVFRMPRKPPKLGPWEKASDPQGALTLPALR